MLTTCGQFSPNRDHLSSFNNDRGRYVRRVWEGNSCVYCGYRAATDTVGCRRCDCCIAATCFRPDHYPEHQDPDSRDPLSDDMLAAERLFSLSRHQAH
jgi:hypothetical protein